MFRFYLRCLQLAFTGAWGAVSTATTLIGIVLAAIADKKPAWASDTLISQLNALGGWVVPLVIFSSILLVRLVLAPYWIYKEHHDKLQHLQMRRPNFRVHKALVPLAPQLFPPVPPADTNGPPLGVVTFDLDFVNVGVQRRTTLNSLSITVG
jgi:hypothetical protein